MFVDINNNQHRKMIESCIISNFDSIKQHISYLELKSYKDETEHSLRGVLVV